MNLFILRHGIASDPGEHGLPKTLKDADRPLSPKGREKLQRLTAMLREQEIKFDAIIASPLLRARQTAMIVAEELELRRKLVLSDHLSPAGSPKLLIEQMNTFPGKKRNILLVGHEPYLGQFLSLLISGSTTASFDLKKGGLAKLEVNHLSYARCAKLEWLLTPKFIGKFS